ncbi:MAG: glycosyltransferase family 4 protein [Bacteroidota bacterium]|nr:glycosyltransferase family 4 protein [Bacteroidota bacterium]
MKIALISRSTLYTQPGGDTVQVESTAAGLKNLGHKIVIVLAGQKLPEDIELVHGFNLGRPDDLLPYFKNFKGKKVLSTLFVDYSPADKNRFPMLSRILGTHALEWFKTMARGINNSDNVPSFSFLFHGQKKNMLQLLSKSDLVITSTMSEFERIQQLSSILGKSLKEKHRVIPLGISNVFINSPKNNKNRNGLLMVGRLEFIKNQHKIIEWATKYRWPLTVVGGSNKNQQAYARFCKSIAGPSIKFIGHQNKEKIVELMDEHRCLVIPSLFETYSLVGWEAAARGLSVVANNSADMIESLASIANLVDIENESEFIAAVEAGMQGQKKSQVQFENYTWDYISKMIDKAYR